MLSVRSALLLTLGWMVLQSTADAQTPLEGYYHVDGQPFEFRLLSRVEEPPTDPDNWERRVVPGQGDAFVAKSSLFTSADIEWVLVSDRRKAEQAYPEVQRSLIEQPFSIYFRLVPATWDRVAVVREREAPTAFRYLGLALLRDGEVVARFAGTEHAAWTSLQESTVRSLVNGLRPWPELPNTWLRADRDREHAHWIAQRLASLPAPTAESTGRHWWQEEGWLGDLAGRADDTLLCELAEQYVDRFIASEEEFPSDEYPGFELARVAGCYADREDYDKAELLIGRVRNSSLTAKDRVIDAMTRSVADTKKYNEEHPAEVPWRFWAAHDCPGLIRVTERTIALVGTDPHVGRFVGRLLTGTVQCLVETGQPEAATRLLERARALPIPEKDTWLPLMERATAGPDTR